MKMRAYMLCLLRIVEAAVSTDMIAMPIVKLCLSRRKAGLATRACLCFEGLDFNDCCDLKAGQGMFSVCT